MQISLNPEFEQLVDEKIRSGEYDSPAHVVEAGLRLLRERDERQRQLEELKQDLAIGLEEADQGELAPLNVEAIKAEGRRRLSSQSSGQ